MSGFFNSTTRARTPDDRCQADKLPSHALTDMDYFLQADISVLIGVDECIGDLSLTETGCTDPFWMADQSYKIGFEKRRGWWWT